MPTNVTSTPRPVVPPTTPSTPAVPLVPAKTIREAEKLLKKAGFNAGGVDGKVTLVP